MGTVIGPGECVGQGTLTCPGAIEDLAGTDPLSIVATTSLEPITGLDPSNNTVWTADLQQWVVRDLNTNTLDFWYFVDVTAGPKDITGVTSNGFAGAKTDVGATCTMPSTQGPCRLVSVPAGNAIPDYVVRSDNGDAVTFTFLEVIPQLVSTDSLSPSEQPFLLVIDTNATSYTTSTTSLTGGGGKGTGATFAPAAVPEPGYSTVLVGFVVIGMLARKRITR